MRWIGLNNSLIFLYISALGISAYIALILPFIVCVPVNFVMNKYRAFRWASADAGNQQ